MKNKRFHIIKKLLALPICLMLFSCVKEDMSECSRDIRVYFTLPAQGDAINPADVDRMHLYVFSDNGYFVGEYRNDGIANFGSDYYINCSDLPPGNYRFIAWGGMDEISYSTSPVQFVKGETTFDEALLVLNRSGNILSTSPHPLFYGDLPTVAVTDQTTQRFDMPLTQITNTVTIRTVGLPADADTYTFNITDSNGAYGFDSSFASPSGATFTYTVTCTKDGANQLHATLTVLRLSADRRTPQLQIYNQTADTPLYPVGTQSGDLIGLILKAYPQNNFDTTHTYEIVLTFTADFKVTVAINGWQVRDEGNTVIE